MKPQTAPDPDERWLARQFSMTGSMPDLVPAVRKNPELIARLIRGIGFKPAHIKFGSAKALCQIAQQEPRLVYPHFDFFLRLLDSENHVLRWNAITTMGFLAAADTEGRVEPVLDRILGIIPGPEMIAAATAIRAGAAIALAKPNLAAAIATAILGVREARYKTDECRNIAIGHAIDSLGSFVHLLDDRQRVADFVRAQLENTRRGTRVKAERFLKQRAAAASV